MIQRRWSSIRNRAKAACLTLLVALAGCAAAPKQALDQEAAKNIRKIAVVEAREPVKYVALNLGHPGMLFGAIGGAIAGASMEDNGTKLTSALRAKEFGISKRLTDKTAEALAALGYEVVRVPDVREVKDGKMALDYRNVHTDADAILNVTPTLVGYISTRGFNDYVPALGVIVELVSKGKDEVNRLYQDRFMFGWEPSAGNWIHVPAPTNYRYSNVEELINRSADAGAGLHVGAELVGERLAKDLRKKP
jgi:hypothetical protein